MKKVHTNKGFTIAELMIVVAVIAVLVAIAIPTFADQRDKAAQAVDYANMRDAYAAARIEYVANKPTANVTYQYDAATGALKAEDEKNLSGYCKSVNSYGSAGDKWTIDISNKPADLTLPTSEGAVGQLLKVTITATSGAVALTWAAPAS